MDGQKTLSLVIPCYNEERTLTACIKQVLAIATANLKLEVVIVDDCMRLELLPDPGASRAWLRLEHRLCLLQHKGSFH